MKRKFFPLLIIFLIINNTNWAQITDPDWFFLRKDDSLVFHLLDGVNTKSDECFPVIVNKTFCFNSDRKNLSGDEASLAYNENAYTAQLKDGKVSEIRKNYFLNTDDHTVVVGFNKNILFLYKTFGEGDIYFSLLNPKGWTNPKKMKSPINSEGHEQSIAWTNKLLVLSSERKGGCMHDIYWAEVSFGDEIGELNIFPYNSSADEVDVSLSSDGRTLYFSSDKTGNYDIYISTFENSVWQVPILLPTPINSSYNDRSFRDCDSIFYLDSDRNGNCDLFEGYTFPRKTSVTKIILAATVEKKSATMDTMLVITKTTVTKNISISQDSLKTASADTNLLVEIKKPDRFDLISNYMDSVGHIKEYYARVQIGAYYQYSVQEFKKVYPSLKNTEIIIESVRTEKGSTIQKFLISQKFSTLEEASRIQAEMVEKHKIKDAFVAVYSVENQRIAIFNVYTGDFVLLSGDKKPVKF